MTNLMTDSSQISNESPTNNKMKKTKKIPPKIQEKINRNIEMTKVVDIFNHSEEFDCNKFERIAELYEKRKSNNQNQKENEKELSLDEKPNLTIHDIKEIENTVPVNGQPKKKKASWRLLTMITLNGIFFFVELIVGMTTHSLALQSDAFNMLSDETSVIIGYIVHRYSKKMSTSRMSFGYVRAETIGGLCNSVFMYAVALTIFLNAIELFIDPYEIEHSIIFLFVGIVGLVVNFIGVVFFSTSDDDNIKGVFLHALGDLLGSVGVLISALIQNYSNSRVLKNYIDPIISIIIAISLVFGTTGLFKKTIKIVSEIVPDELQIDEIRMNILLKVENIYDIHDLHIWALVNNVYVAVMHVIINENSDRKKIVSEISNYLLAYGIASTTIQIEYKSDFPPLINDKRNCCAFSSNFNHRHRIFDSYSIYKHLIGCNHISLMNDCFEDSYDYSNLNLNYDKEYDNSNIDLLVPQHPPC